MDPTAILAVMSDLRLEIARLQAENEALREAIQAQRQEPGA